MRTRRDFGNMGRGGIMGAGPALPEFLASLGKTELKPGGTYATGALLRMLDLKAEERVLVVGPKAGSTALFVSMTQMATTEALVASESDKVADHDPSLRRKSTARVGRFLQMPFEDAVFDVAIVEATLASMHPREQAAALQEVCRVLKPGGRIAIHELCWRQPPTPEVEAALQKAWGDEVYPHVVRGWWDLLEAAGFEKITNELAVVTYFSRKGMENDEGDEVTAAIFHNVQENPAAQARFAAAYQEFTDNRRYHGVILAMAVKVDS